MRIFLLAVMVCMFSCNARAQSGEEARPAWEIGVQGAVMSPGPGNNGLNVSDYGGIRIDPAWTPLPKLGLRSDFGFYRSAGHNFVTFMAGPEFSTLEQYRTRWFAHAFFGGAHGSVEHGPVKTGSATAWGGGLDIRLTDRVVLRPVEGEFVAINGLGGARFSSGLVFCFGK